MKKSKYEKICNDIVLHADNDTLSDHLVELRETIEELDIENNSLKKVIKRLYDCVCAECQSQDSFLWECDLKKEVEKIIESIMGD